MAKQRAKKGSKPKAAKGGGEEESRAVRPSEVRKMIPGTTIKSLLAEIRKTKSQVSELSGELGERIKKKCDDFHFSKRILRFLASLNNLPPEKLVFELEDLEHGLEASGLNDRAQDAPKMAFGPGGEGDGEGDEEGEGEGEAASPDNVRHLRAAE